MGEDINNKEAETDNNMIAKPIRKDINVKIRIDELVDFKNHPFKKYEGQRFQDMVESIKANGVIIPIIVRPVAGDVKYEILSGHNRAAAAKEANLTFIPAVIKQGLTDDEALLIVTETNLIQRSFADLTHSERAVALATHYEAMKKKSGYRSDLLKEIETLTSAPVGRRSDTREKLGSQYGLSKNTVARYLNISKLLPELKERLDNNSIGMRVAESLSSLRTEEQNIAESLLKDNNNITMEQAEKLRKASAAGELNKPDMLEIIKPKAEPIKVKPRTFSGEFLSKYFNETHNAEDIKNIIDKALKQYFSK